MVAFTGVKVFSATKAWEREQISDRINEWLSMNPTADIVDKVVTQSSDSEFHCLTITLFYNLPAGVRANQPPAAVHSSRTGT
ncbi:MAG: hypothetical protein IPK80_18205 [Nannocystis sp.]|jgi:hypothetical protein|nr:hypothetical protein [Nannocystis sp.]